VRSLSDGIKLTPKWKPSTRSGKNRRANAQMQGAQWAQIDERPPV
jgi:hypothetical protein